MLDNYRFAGLCWVVLLPLLLAACQSMGAKSASPEEDVLLVYLTDDPQREGSSPATVLSTKETLYLREPPVLTRQDIRTARLADDPFGDVVVHLELTAEASERFYEVTARHLNERLAIVYRGVVVSAPRIMTAIPSGSIHISDGSEAVRRIVEEFDQSQQDVKP